MDQRVGMDRRRQIILQAAGEVEGRLGLDVLDALQQRRIALPADLDTAEQIGFGAGHLEQALRLERRLGTEDGRVGLEADLGATSVGDLADLLELALGMAALEN